MRTMLKWLAAVLLIALPVWALAQTRADFELSCSYKTAREAAFYAAAYATDEQGDQTAVYTQTATLLADTYIRLTGAKDEANGMRECWYYQDSAAVKGWIAADAVIPATLLLYLDNGSTIRITETLLRDEAALAAHMAKCYPGRLYGLTPPPTPAPTPTPTPEPIVPDAWVSAPESAMAETDFGVKLVQMGLYESTVMNKDFATTAIPNVQLYFAQNEPAAAGVVIIHAPKGGNASLREKAATNGKKIADCPTGTILPLLEKGPTFSLVRYGDQVGYVINTALTFWDTTRQPIGQGMIHYNGATDGANDVTMRTDAGTSTAKVAELPTGTVVTIFAEDGATCFVEWNGLAGCIQKKYVTAIPEDAAKEE